MISLFSTTSIVIISILSVLVLVLAFTTFNLLNKNEKFEDVIVSYRDFIKKFQDTIDVVLKPEFKIKITVAMNPGLSMNKTLSIRQ